MDEAVRVRLLGPLEAEVGGALVDLGGPRQRAVLALLLVARGEVVSLDRLIDDLWRGEPPPRATGALQAYVSNLRRALEPGRPPRAPARLLISAAPGYAVRLPDTAVDGRRFEAVLRAADPERDPAAAVVALEQALGEWRGPALAEFASEPWAAAEAARYAELRLTARERLVDARIRITMHAEAVVEGEALVRENPLREQGWCLLATAQYAAGRQADALATLRRARALLADELGIDPGRRLLELEQAVLTQTVELPPGPPVATTRPSAPVTPFATDPAAPPAAQRVFVGRVAELAALQRAAAAATAHDPSVVLVAGDAGSGKSALLDVVARELAAAGWRVALGRCPESAGGPPAWAWAEVVRTLATEVDPGGFTPLLAPLLADPVPSRPGSEGAPSDAAGPSVGVGEALIGRFQLHRAVADWLARLDDRPLAILLEDMHRADDETQALLHSVLDGPPGARRFVVVAHRPDAGPALENLLATLAPRSPVRVRLAGLAEIEIRELVTAITGSRPEPAVVDALARRTDGNPFYVQESARLLASEGVLVATSQVPEGVGDVLRRRFARLPEEVVSVLRLAAVVGRDVDVDLLVRAAEAGEDEVLDALEAGVVAGLLVEPSPGLVRFSHLLVRETLYAGVPALRRRRWHARVADAVADLHPEDLAALAHHSVAAATPASAAAAARHAVAAAERATMRYAYDAAAQLYRQAAQCLDLAPGAPAAARVEARVALVRALVSAGATVASLQVRREAVEIAQRDGDDELLIRAIVSWDVPTPWLTRPYLSIDPVLVDALDRLLARPDQPPAVRCRLLCSLVREVSGADQDRAEHLVAEALGLARVIGDPQLLALALVAQAEVISPDLDRVGREALRTEMAEIARQHELPVFDVIVAVLSVQRSVLELDLERAEQHLELATELATRYQLGQTLVVTRMMWAMLAHVRGDLERSAELYTEAFEANLRGGGVNAEGIWILAMTTLRRTQGRLGELVDGLRALHAQFPGPGSTVLALALLATGARAEARALVSSTGPFARDFFWTLFVSARALVLAEVGTAQQCRTAYAELSPHRGELAGGGTGAYALAPVDLILARLARAFGDEAAADEHLRAAADIAARCGSPHWLAEVRDLRSGAVVE